MADGKKNKKEEFTEIYSSDKTPSTALFSLFQFIPKSVFYHIQQKSVTV